MSGDEADAPARQATVTLVAGASGGCGASLFAGALALALARDGAATWLVELDLERGDRGEAWGMPRGRTLGDLAVVAQELEARHLRQAAHAGPGGLRVLNAPPHPGAADPWTAPTVGRLVRAARVAAGAQGHVVVDAGTGLPAPVRAASQQADDVLIVCSPAVPSIRRARRLVEALASSGAKARCGLVVGCGPAPREIGARALARVAGVPVRGELPWVPAEAARLAAGQWPTGRRRRLAAAVATLAGELT